MGKQSARLYYRGKDHKDIYFQGKYHNAMIVRKEDKPELVWRKLYDEGYFVYTRLSGPSGSPSYYTAILYPKYRIREYYGEIAQVTYHSNKHLARKYTGSWLGAVISYDGKLWKRIEGNNTEYGVVPKADGIVIYSVAGYQKYKYTYIPIVNGDVDEENALEIYFDASGKVGGIFSTVGITDFCLLLDESKYPIISALAVDMQGNVYNELFATRQDQEIGGSGYYNGMYYCVFTNVGSGCYVYVSNSIGGPWERRSFPVRATKIYTIQTSNEIVVYVSSVNDNIYSAVQIYTTTDFISYKRISIPNNLTVSIIGAKYDEEKEYINFRMAREASAIENAYNLAVYGYDLYSVIGNMAKNTICYIEKCKISPPKGMIIQQGSLESAGRVTVYLDNLFFQPSEGNFAFFEELYPETFMNDYLEERR